MGNKKGSLSTVFLVIAIILIIVMGVLLYMQKTEADRQMAELQKQIESISNTINSNNENINDKTEENEIKNEDVLGEYVYEVPQQIKDEFGHYYDGITIKLLESNKFEYHRPEGFVLKGIYSIDKANVIFNATTEEGEYVKEHKINDKYTFKYENNMLELIKYEGIEIEQDNDVFERIGSKYVKNIENHNGKINMLTEQEALKILNEKFKIVETLWLNPLEYFEKSSQPTSVNNGNYFEIKNFETTIKKYGTDNLLQEYNRNLPSILFKENDKVYTFEGTGGAKEYSGIDIFENIQITSSSITATLKTKQSTYNGNEWGSTSGKSSEFKLIKEGNEWLIDKFNSSDLD